MTGKLLNTLFTKWRVRKVLVKYVSIDTRGKYMYMTWEVLIYLSVSCLFTESMIKDIAAKVAKWR